MGIGKIFETALLVSVLIFVRYQKCAAHPDKTISEALMEVDIQETTQSKIPHLETLQPGESAPTVKSSSIYESSPTYSDISISKDLLDADIQQTTQPASQPDKSALLKSDAIYQSLPDYLKPYNEQVAGRGLGPDRIGILYDADGNVYKPNPLAEEVAFYEKLKAATDPVLKELQNYVPAYFETKMIPIGNTDINFMHMTDIMKGYEKPCSIDVKIKHMIWDPPFKADQPLRFKEMTDAFGFGITGFKYYDVMTGIDVKNEKEFVFNMKPHEGIQTLYKFINGKIGIRCGVLNKIIEELQKIRAWFIKQQYFIFNNNSVLLTYDAKDLVAYVRQVKESARNGNLNKDCSNFDIPVRVRMVFFGKVVEIGGQGGRDEKYLKALETLIPVLEDIGDRETSYDPLLSTIPI